MTQKIDTLKPGAFPYLVTCKYVSKKGYKCTRIFLSKYSSGSNRFKRFMEEWARNNNYSSPVFTQELIHIDNWDNEEWKESIKSAFIFDGKRIS